MLEDLLLKDKKFCMYMDIYLQKSRNHAEDVYECIKLDIMKKYQLDNTTFESLHTRYKQKYIETDTYARES